MKKGITLFAFLIIVLSLFGQDSEEERYELDSLEVREDETITRGFMLDFHFAMGIPLGAFKESLDRNAFGFGMKVLVDSKKTGSSIWYGGGFNLLRYGTSSIDFNIDNGNFIDEYELEIRSSIMDFSGVVRYVPQWNSKFLPYIDGIIGTKVLLTATEIYEDDFGERISVDSETNEIDWALEYGVGAGILYRVKWEGRVRIYVDLNLQYLKGSSAEYLVRTSSIEQFENPIDAYEMRVSTTDILMPQLGLVIEFQ